ncbi:MAG TPA: ABC transporter ATP-binding protein [Nitrospiria bacterium]|nr:ABC transporter ATP-binding protein [Nitrospiria bacterium]HUK55162.1 ABC transporter ATP-binding protein [Nitrospiria bacterium]
MTLPLIQIEDLWKIYQTGEIELAALKGVSLSIPHGEFVAIMGPSGSGKSTMMHILGCLDRPTRGRYLLDGVDVGGLGPNDRARIRNHKVGFVFQGFNLLHRTTAIENVELPILYDGLSGRERAAKAGEALERVGLGDRRYHYPNQLSGGQQQRVAIARALVMRPPLILADEPTGNLDTRTSVEIMALFQELNRDGITIMVVTHEPDIATYAARVITFRDGTIRSDRSVSHHADAKEVLSKGLLDVSKEAEESP